MTPKQTLDFIRYHGVVLEAARGHEPSLVERIVGGRVKGSWWGHPQGHEIYDLTQRVHASKAVLICTLANGRITYIHRRLWPFFVRMVHKFPPHALDQVRQVHMENGRHRREDIPFPAWVPDDVCELAKSLTVNQAESEILKWIERYGVKP